MNEIRLKNFRCFHENQVARLAPLTLLVGENSTGKTSFMAMVRALWDIAYRDRVPDFKEDPYDLGSFDEIAHHRGAKGGRVSMFEAGFTATRVRKKRKGDKPRKNRLYYFDVTFEKDGTVPVPVRRRFAHEKVLIEESWKVKDLEWQLRIGTGRGSWQTESGSVQYSPLDLTHYMIRPLFYSVDMGEDELIPLQGSREIEDKDIEEISDLLYRSLARPRQQPRPYASAPVRSKPRRTYDPTRLSPDPEGDYVPMYLANVYLRHKEVWKSLKDRLESFGQASGLFNEISVKPLGVGDSGPFQLRVRKFGGGRKGPWRNLVDVGYGVSQVLPVITELLRSDTPPLVLLQQPEVHLHPSAQAALGSLFCEVAAQGHQLIIETHSDYLLDRIRMDVRDGNVQLEPDDVSILFFERGAQDVRIHSLRLDKEGNILDAPPHYRRFFMEETRRSLGL